ncbi:MAG: PotD/PotF family extracellular solute-binding protein [Micrococcales bacterium]
MSLSNDSAIKNLIKSAKAQQVTRRTVLAGASAAAAVTALAACAPGGSTTKLQPAEDLSDSEKEVTWDNWPYYMDGETDGTFPTLNEFTAQTGIKVNYPINVDDNNTYFARVKNALAAGKDTGADTMCLTDWMASRLIANGYVQELQYDLMPNVTANLDPAFGGDVYPWDPGRKYSLPWKGIIAAVGYHKAAYKAATGKDAPTSLEDLWVPELKGKIVVLSEMRDTIGVMMLAKGIDITSFTADDFHNTLDQFTQLSADGQFANILGNSYVEMIKEGKDAIAGIVWAGDLVATNDELGNEDLGVVLLESGSTFACDNYQIPMGARHAKNAHTLINYYYEPEVAAILATSGVYYVSPVVGAQEAATAINPAIGNNTLIFPTAEDYKKLKAFRPLTPAEEREFSQAWSDATTGVL